MGSSDDQHLTAECEAARMLLEIAYTRLLGEEGWAALKSALEDGSFENKYKFRVTQLLLEITAEKLGRDITHEAIEAERNGVSAKEWAAGIHGEIFRRMLQ